MTGAMILMRKKVGDVVLYVLFIWQVMGAVVMFTACTATAKSPIQATEAAPAPLPANVVSVPIQLVHGVDLVPATVAGHSGWFVLDLGSPETVLNSRYLRGTDGGGFDTVTTDQPPQSSQSPIVPHLMLQIGTRTISVDPVVGTPFPVAAAIISLAVHERFIGHTILGIFGQNVFLRNEVILDYIHHRLILIPVDTAGQREIAVPQYVPTGRVPIFYGAEAHWYIVATLGGMMDTLLLDTGNDLNELNVNTQARIASHVRSTGETLDVLEEHQKPRLVIDHLAFAGKSYDTVPFYGSHVRTDCLSNAFFQQLGVVGFNFPAQQLLLYH